MDKFLTNEALKETLQSMIGKENMSVYPKKVRMYGKTLGFSYRVAREFVFTQNIATRARNLQKDIVRMGPVYIKMGQIVSTRTDVFPDEITSVFEDLQSDVNCMGIEQVRRVFRNEFDSEIEDHFVDFSTKPVAAASIAQVHVGTLKNRGAKVAVKVLREDIEARFKEEVSSIIDLLSVLRFVTGNRNKNVDDTLTILRQQYANVERETNLNIEQDNMRVFHKIMRSNDRIIVPRSYSALSGRSVMTMEYVPSVKITDRKKLSLSDETRRELATMLMRTFVTTVLQDGYLHCDPHPGNIGYTSDDKVVLYDFGLVRTFSLDLKAYFRKIFMALVNRRNEEMLEFMLSSGIIVANESEARNLNDLTEYERIVISRIIDYVYVYLTNMNVMDLLRSIENDPYIDVNDVPFEFDPQLVYLFQSFSTLEGVCKQLYPEFSYIELISNLIFDFLDLEMIINKATYDIQSSSAMIMENGMDFVVPNGGRDRKREGDTKEFESFAKLSIEKINKRIDKNVDNVQLLLVLSALLDVLLVLSGN